MRNMAVKIRPRHEDRKVELLYEYTEKKLNEKREPDMVISLDIANAMAFANQLTKAVEILLNDGVHKWQLENQHQYLLKRIQHIERKYNGILWL